MSDSQLEEMIATRRHEPGGPWYIELSEEGCPAVSLGPYGNPAIAEQDAKKLRDFLAALLARETRDFDNVSEHELFG